MRCYLWENQGFNKPYKGRCFVLTSTIREVVVPEESSPSGWFNSEVAPATCLLGVCQIHAVLDQCLENTRQRHSEFTWVSLVSTVHILPAEVRPRVLIIVSPVEKENEEHAPAPRTCDCLPQEKLSHRRPPKSSGRTTQ